MPTIKLKISQSNVRKCSTSGKPKASRKKCRVTSYDDEEDDYSTPKSEDDEEDCSTQSPSTSRQTRQRQRPRMNRIQSQPPDVENLFEDDLNVDILNNISSPPPPDSDDLPDRAPTPLSAPPRRRNGRKRAVPVFSDEDEEYVDSGGKVDDKDEDFIVDSPPRRSGKKGGAGPGRGRGKCAKDKSGIGEIHIKDERKFPPPPPAVAAAPPGNEVRVGPGAKRRRETVSNTPNGEAFPSITEATPTTTGGTPQVPGTTQEGPGAGSGTSTAAAPPSKIRKLPPIKKNKALAGDATSTAPSSGPSTPSASASAATKTGAASNAASSLPIHTSLPRKPPLTKTSEVDLTSPDIYNSLFKTGSSAPRVGVNSRVKEEERRKELMKMRNEARAARMANLQKNSFDLLAAQTKVERFEAKLRARNSPALYPNHLGSALKMIAMKRNAASLQRPPGPAGRSGNSGTTR